MFHGMASNRSRAKERQVLLEIRGSELIDDASVSTWTILAITSTAFSLTTPSVNETGHLRRRPLRSL